MKLYGYHKRRNKNLELREVCISTNLIELEKLIDFLQYVKEQHSKVKDEEGFCHSHYRDWDSEWDSELSDDLIVVTTSNDKK